MLKAGVDMFAEENYTVNNSEVDVVKALVGAELLELIKLVTELLGM